MTINSSPLVRKIRLEVGKERIQDVFRNITCDVKNKLSFGETTLQAMELIESLGDYTKPKRWYNRLTKEHLEGVGKEVFIGLEKMGLNPRVSHIVNEYYDYYEIRIYF